MSEAIALARPALALLTGLLAACHATTPTLAPSELRTLASARSADTLVYRGTVYPEAAPAAFVYERRVGVEHGDAISSHVTLRPDGEAVVLHRAQHASSYALTRFDAIQRQTGVSGSVAIVGDRVELSARRGTHVVTRHERLTAPVVVGPTLFGVILREWDALASGQAVAIRFAVVERARTYAFTLRRVSADAEHTRIELRADRLLVRASVPPMTITFDTNTRKVVRYEGRVPPMLETSRGLRPFDARVEYEFVAPDYR